MKICGSDLGSTTNDTVRRAARSALEALLCEVLVFLPLVCEAPVCQPEVCADVLARFLGAACSRCWVRARFLAAARSCRWARTRFFLAAAEDAEDAVVD